MTALDTARQAFDRYSRGWRSTDELARALGPLIELAEEQARQLCADPDEPIATGRTVPEILEAYAFDQYIVIAPVVSARDDWHVASCLLCGWESFGGIERVVEQAGHEHIAARHPRRGR